MALDIVALVGSSFVVAAAFVDPGLASLIGLSPDQLRLAVGLAGIAVFSVSLISLRVDWTLVAQRHDEASRKLAELKSRGRLLASRERTDSAVETFLELADAHLSNLPPIPGPAFPKLKAAHLRKIQLSRILDEHPGASLMVLRMKLRISDSLTVLRRKPGGSDKEVEEQGEPG